MKDSETLAEMVIQLCLGSNYDPHDDDMDFC